MNERIKQLALQANLEIDPAHPDHNQQVLEKFAELIVRECADIAADAEQSKGGMPAKYHVLDHFGVAE